MTTFISLDLETTGLDPNTDSIIEIGAVKFNENRVEGEYSTLINPRKPISNFITNLTGITNTMVLNKPFLADALPDLARFVGDAIIIGQNIAFDLGFLQKTGLFRNNLTIDTYELASVLLPRSPRYNLSALAQQLGVVQTAAHRALDDAQTARQVFQILTRTIDELPVKLIAEIVRQSDGVDWKAELPFRWALKKKNLEGIQVRRVTEESEYDLEFARPARVRPLEPREVPTPIDADKIAETLQPGGEFSRHFPEFEHRSQQVQVLKSVANAFSRGDHLLVEAGTGTGKSLAYLIPAAYWALQNEERVLISTNTIALQDQLIKKDIPALKEALGIEINTAVLKGRGNYLCPRRLGLMRKRGPENADELRVLAKVLVWLQNSQSGDRSEINLNGPIERLVWSRMSAEDEGCRLENCLKRSGGRCPFYKARMAAEAAHIIVVNHALLLADAATQNRVLPAYNYLIVDEAHHLESATTDAMSYRLRAPDVTRLIREFGSQESGLFGRVMDLAKLAFKPSDQARLGQLIGQASTLAFRFDSQMTTFFKALDYLLEERREGKPIGTYPQQERILTATRTMPAWLDVEIAWEAASASLTEWMETLSLVRDPLKALAESGREEAEDLLGSLGTMAGSLEEMKQQVEGLTMSPRADQIYWVELDPLQHRLTLQVAPLNIGGLMEKYLWHEKASVVLTSATLTTHGEFDYLRRRLNADEANELTVGSPFDYENSALILLPTDIPEPVDAFGHQKVINDSIVRISKSSQGRMLVLFTSYAQLQKTAKAIEPQLSKLGITLFEQGEGASATALLEVFKETPKAVLLGTRAFWEGVDVPGDALSVLVIAKLPFDVPSDPIIAARAESFEDPFNEYGIPEAILRFRQGFGRLIRTQSDRGVVVILDKRVTSKTYGRLFMESLPRCTVDEGSVLNLPEKTAKWLEI